MLEKVTSFFIKLKSFFNIYKAPLLSGVLFGSSFIPFPFFTLFFALVPLWFFIYCQKSFKKVLIGSLLCQALATFVGFNWMIYTFHSFGGMNWFISFILLILFCCFANICVLVSSCLWFVLVKKSSYSLPVSVKLILFPLIFSILHSLIPTIFPWDMGYPWFWGGLPGAQTAELWGFRFLDTLFYIFNLLFLILYKHLGDRGKKHLIKIIILLACFCLLGFYVHTIFYIFIFLLLFFYTHYFDSIGKKALIGTVVLFVCLNTLGFYLKWRLPQPDKSLNVIVVQHNVGSVHHSNFSKRKALHILKDLTYKAVDRYAKTEDKQKDIGFVLWPEGAYGYTINKNHKRERKLSKIVEAMRIPLITGAVSRDREKHSGSLVVFDREGNILKPVYDKTKLVIFGEYFPWIESFPFLRKLFPYFDSNFTPGKDVQVQELEGTQFGWQICYESLFDYISRKLAQKQAQVLVNITNDSWYGSWQEPLQHLTMNFARAIEVRRPLIRSTNTGYSGVIYADGTLANVIYPDGAVRKISPLNKPWFYLYKVPYYSNPPKTLFMSWGYYINEMFLFFLFLFVGVVFLKYNFRSIQKI